MPMAEGVADFYEMWLASIKLGNSIEAAANYNNVVAHSRNILAYVVQTAAISTVMGRAIKASQGYFLEQQDFLAKPSNSEALVAMRELAIELETAEASDMAKALGLG